MKNQGNGGGGSYPGSQTRSGTGSAPLGNPKADDFADSMGIGADTDTAADSGTGYLGAGATATGWDAVAGANPTGRGMASDIPDEERINAYTAPVAGSVPGTSNPGANRQRFGINPGNVDLDGGR